MAPTFRLALITVAATLAYRGLAILGGVGLPPSSPTPP